MVSQCLDFLHCIQYTMHYQMENSNLVHVVKVLVSYPRDTEVIILTKSSYQMLNGFLHVWFDLRPEKRNHCRFHPLYLKIQCARHVAELLQYSFGV